MPEDGDNQMWINDNDGDTSSSEPLADDTVSVVVEEGARDETQPIKAEGPDFSQDLVKRLADVSWMREYMNTEEVINDAIERGILDQVSKAINIDFYQASYQGFLVVLSERHSGWNVKMNFPGNFELLVLDLVSEVDLAENIDWEQNLDESLTKPPRDEEVNIRLAVLATAGCIRAVAEDAANIDEKADAVALVRIISGMEEIGGNDAEKLVDELIGLRRRFMLGGDDKQ